MDYRPTIRGIALELEVIIAAYFLSGTIAVGIILSILAAVRLFFGIVVANSENKCDGPATRKT